LAFGVGAFASGAATYGLFGLSGEALGLSNDLLGVAWVAIAVAFVLDAVRIRPPGPRRQVNEDWLGTYRDWVVGLGFGLQLGTGIATYVTVWAVWALLLSSMFVGFPTAALMGVMFGFGRSVLLIRTAGIETAGDLSHSMRTFAGFENRARSLTYAGYGLVLILGVTSAI
jgi:hypothetical protein